jgi:hypothetical protein
MAGHSAHCLGLDFTIPMAAIMAALFYKFSLLFVG